MSRDIPGLRWLRTARVPATAVDHGEAERPGAARLHEEAKPCAETVRTIAASGLFNAAYYSRQSGADGSLRELIAHYLARSPGDRVPPSPHFDPGFYNEAYADVAAAGDDPFLHYVLNGFKEHRYPSLRRAEADAREIIASEQFDEDLYRRQRGADARFEHPVIDYLVHGALLGARPNETFDQHFVHSYYDLLRRGHSNLFVFYCRNRGRPWCHAGRHTLGDMIDAVEASGIFRRSFYREKYLADRPDLDEVVHYCTEGYMRGFDASEVFSTHYYLNNYGDIARAEMNPLYHFERYGKKEGRKSSASLANSIEKGGRQAAEGKPWVLIASHEASLSGAPIVGLRLAERMSAHANVVTWIGRDGPLTDRFRDASAKIVRSFVTEAERHIIVAQLMKSQPIDFAIVNSIVSRAVIPALVQADVPIVSLVHEFSEYAKPAGWVSNVVLNSVEAIVPARIVEASLLKELEDLRIPDRPAGVTVRSQGRCEVRASGDASSLTRDRILERLGLEDAAERPRIVLGCGAVQHRKGVDIFVETARRVKASAPEPIIFVWVGGGYRPKEDLSYSVYLADQVERSGLVGTMHFFGEQADLDPFWRLADVFYLPSRLDPFPNVALDAIGEGLPLVCFENASGIAELAGRVPDSVFAVPYHDTAAAAGKLIALAQDAPERRRRMAERLPALAETFSMDNYADAVFAIGREARRKHDALLVEAEAIEESGLFDAAFFQKGLTGWAEPFNPLPHRRAADLIRLYLRLAAHGVEIARPFPGATSRPRLADGQPLAREIHAGDVAFTSPPTARADEADGARFVLHAHLSAAPDRPSVDALIRCASACAVVVTTDQPEVARSLTEMAGPAAPFRIVVRPDYSDPLLAFLRVIGADALSSPVVGHLWLPHPDDAKGFRADRLTRGLDFYGSPERSRQALDLFAADPDLALVFPEHAAVRGSARAQAVAAALADAAHLAPAPGGSRWPLDLVFWLHLDRVPGLRSGAVLEASRRQAPTAALQDRLDGFGVLLPRLCASEGAKAVAIHDPAEDTTAQRPLIFPD